MPDRHSGEVLQPIMPLSRIPVLRALLMQCLAFPLAIVAAVLLESQSLIAVPPSAWLVLQGLFAALLSRTAGLAPWWQAIQLLLPPAAAVAGMLPLPPQAWLLAFAVLVALYWSTFRTQVPYFPSTRPTWEAVARLLDEWRAPRFVDIGSGFGGLVLHLAATRPAGEYAGVEVAPLPWLVSRLRAWLGGVPARLLRRDYHALDLGQFDVVFAFLSPAAMPSLWEKVRREMRPGTMFVSYEFPVPGVAPDRTIGPDARGATMYLWMVGGDTNPLQGDTRVSLRQA